MTLRHGKKVSSKVVRELLKTRIDRIDETMSRELMGKVYVLEDGGALFVDYNGTGVVWDSHEELTARYSANVKQALERRDPLLDVLPDSERFRTDALAMAAELPPLLGIKPEVLDYTEGSLDFVDRAIKRLGSERIMTAEVFPYLLAYVGEVIRRQVRGAWELRSTDGGKRLEPEIVEITGGRHQLLRIYKELLEHGRTASMRAFVHVALRKHRLIPPH